MLRTETIERATLELLKTLMQDEKLKQFNLVGGTALALYMGHRKSIDLDLFSKDFFDVKTLEKHLIQTYGFNKYKESDVTLLGFINDVKIDFINYDYQHVIPVNVAEGIRLCSMTDIAAMKLVAISQNGTRLKDFVDIAFLSSEMSFNEMLDTFEYKYPNSHKILVIKGLSYFDDIVFSTEIELINGVFNWKETEKRLKEMIKYPHKVFPQFPIGIESKRKSGVRFKR